jgi:hypothetical protein
MTSARVEGTSAGYRSPGGDHVERTAPTDQRRSAVHARLCPDTVTTEDAGDPVIIEGTAEIVTDPAAIRRFLAHSNAKYQVAYEIDFLDPAVNATVAVRPHRVFGMKQGDFTGSPTRWTLQAG